MESEKAKQQLPSVFIGSSTEGLEVARAIEQHLHDVAETTIWKYGVFRPGVSFLQSLLERVGSFDFAVLALTPDDVVESRDESYSSPRDNVVFELGLFMGRLGPRRTFFLAEDDAVLKLPSDLAGIARVGYRRRENVAAAVSPACTVLRDEIRKQGFLVERKEAPIRPELVHPEAGREHALRLTARQFYGEDLDVRKSAAKKALRVGAKVPLDTVLSMADSVLPGERVAAAIALRAHIRASPHIQDLQSVAASVRRGLDDSRSRVRFRYVQLLGDAKRLVRSLRGEVAALVDKEENDAVRHLAEEVLGKLN